MNDDDKPKRDPDYVLERVSNEFQLRHRGRDSAIFINQTAALLWELCDGMKSVADIKGMLRDAYPEAGDAVDADVDEAMSRLVTHRALRLR